MTDEGERIAKLEARLDHLADTVDKMALKVDELLAIMNAAKGAKWAIIGLASLAGFFSGKLGSFVASVVGK